MRIDPWKHKEMYYKWKLKFQSENSTISKINTDLILQYVSDMEKGLNIASGSVKGPRGFGRLISLKSRLILFSEKFKEMYNLDDLTQISEDQLITFFAELRAGNIKKSNGKIYQSVGTYVKIFKAFWHWYQKTCKKQGIDIHDITVDLDATEEKPRWVYLTEEQVKKLCDNAKYDYKVLIMFLFDTGIRAPTELVNIKVSDFFNNFKELNIREEASKTFGRRIKLMLCSDLIKEYIKTKKLCEEDCLFKITDKVANQYLKRLALKVLGNSISDAGAKYTEISLYDFRHISCCYWLPRYKSESALKYRFGWKKSDKIHYYSELLGMKDTISEDDLLIDVTKTEIEKRLLKSEKGNQILQDRIKAMEEQMKKIFALTNVTENKIAIFEEIKK